MKCTGTDFGVDLACFIRENIGLIKKVIKEELSRRKIHSPEAFGIEYDDLVQEGILGVCEAYERYDEKKGAKFSSFAYFWIRHRVSSFLDRELGWRARRSDGFCDGDLKEDYYERKGVFSYEPSYENFILLNEIKESLEGREREVFDMISKGYRVGEVKEKLGTEAYRRMRRKLKSLFGSPLP